MKKCNFCGNKNIRNTLTQYIYRHNGKMMIVDDVPCEQCEFCGEKYFSAEVLKKIENDFFEVHSARRKPQSEILVPVEHFG
jgi:YgiT-type zinc finger domain-containing protein